MNSLIQKLKSKKSLRMPLFIFVLFCGILSLMEAAGYFINHKNLREWKKHSHETNLDQRRLKDLEKKTSCLQRKIDRVAPSGIYIVIDTANNILYVKKGSIILRQTMISCGSGNILEEPGGKRKWVFDTPMGVFLIESKIKKPSWRKPDWAFIEEGEPIPKDLKDRIETGVLGDYALSFGDGYFIHGTLYTRLLGRSVTHGCIRVGDDDLKEIYRLTSVGTFIFIL